MKIFIFLAILVQVQGLKVEFHPSENLTEQNVSGIWNILSHKKLLININVLVADLDPFAELRILPFKIVTLVLAFSRLTIGLAFYSALIHYEKYGGDPMKRSVNNRIIAQMCQGVLLNSFITEFTTIWMAYFGPISPFFARIFLLNVGIFANILNLGFAEITLWKNFLVFKVFLAAGINDDFVSNFITKWNWFFSIVSQLSLFYLDAQHPKVFEFLTGKFSDLEPLRTGYWAVFYSVCGFISLFGSLIFCIKRFIEKKKEQNLVHNFNTVNINKPIFSAKSMSVFLISSTLAISSFFFYRDYKSRLSLTYTITFITLFVEFFLSIFLPISTFLFHKKFRNHILYNH